MLEGINETCVSARMSEKVDEGKKGDENSNNSRMAFTRET